MMRVAIPDLISNSYFPIVAAVTLDVCKDEGLDASLELVSPLSECMAALRDHRVDIVGCSAHAPLLAFPEWDGARLLCAQSQGLYWLLVMRKDLGIARGDLAALAGRRIAAVPFVGTAFARVLIASGIDPKVAEIEITMPDAARKQGVNFGVFAAEALEERTIDGFFANGMGAEIAVTRGLGDIILDIRRGDGPNEAFGYTFPAVATTERLIMDEPNVAAGMIRAVVKMQERLKRDPGCARLVGERLFPAEEAGLISRVITRDIPFYDASLTDSAVASMTQYACDVGLLQRPVAFDKIVANQFRSLWN